MSAESRPTSVDEVPNDIPETIKKAQAAFRRDLPELLKDRRLRGQWVAYHGEKRVGTGKSKQVLYQQCLRQGMTYGEFVVRFIAPEHDEEIELPVEI
jgi:hypothetical protein